MDNVILNTQIKEESLKAMKKYLGGAGFTARTVTDTPHDALSVVNRNYVTNNGTVRPTSSVKGQPFLDMSLASGRGKPIWWNGTGWVDATGTYV